MVARFQKIMYPWPVNYFSMDEHAKTNITQEMLIKMIYVSVSSSKKNSILYIKKVDSLHEKSL